MDKNRTDGYAATLLDAYNGGLLKIIWNTSGFSLGINSDKRAQIPELKEKQFIDYVFSIVKIVMELADGKEIVDGSDQDIEAARQIYEQEYDLKNHLYVKRNSKMNCFRLLECEIVGHRNQENPEEITANSAIIKLVSEKDDEDISYVFEVSKRDLEDMIHQLSVLKEKMDSL